MVSGQSVVSNQLVVRRPLSAVRRPLSVISSPPSAIRRPSSAVYRPPSVIRRLSSVIRCPSSVVCCPSLALSSVARRPSPDISVPALRGRLLRQVPEQVRGASHPARMDRVGRPPPPSPVPRQQSSCAPWQVTSAST